MPTPQVPPPKPPVPSLEPHETELARKAQLLQQVRESRVSLLANMGEVRGRDPEKHYGWVNVHESRVTYYQGMGYVVCRDPKIQTQWVQADGSHRRGDLLLMECPRDLKEAWNYDAELRAIEDVENATHTFKTFAGRNGVPVIEG
jgi:hypothetical protein